MMRAMEEAAMEVAARSAAAAAAAEAALARDSSGDSTSEAVVLEDIQAVAVHVSQTTRQRRVRPSFN